MLIATGSVSRDVSVEAVEGGFRISGRWSFCSGIDHAGWALLRASPTGDQRQTYFLFPRSDFRIDDDWFVSGMSGTGSKKIGRAHVRTPVTNAHLVCRLLLDNKN